MEYLSKVPEKLLGKEKQMETRNKVNCHLASSTSMDSLSSSVYLVSHALGARGASKECLSFSTYIIQEMSPCA